MRNTKMIGVLFAAILVATGSAAIAQQQRDLNPTNDPDVEKGITKEQIDYCARQREAGMTQAEIWQRDNSIRFQCAHPPAVAAVRG